ncbi:MAG: hydrogenase nickel incorporation protein HypB [Candidatus Thiodiazotropha sp. (ex Lucina aurantia)]|uniref:Hydrogenase maturation factor HypB n=1 Tax=Candidatus Thiodiazotropha taylori TaxID=2792791 RepID=A0A9E4NHL2_9GAMM|nr:hydrogenase nickel incorporation protein HypB [Candidatus Thiodiazotropha sp. (ex Lucina pensylvanica)]MBT3024573.1 hydrogenase nickel incorporation protein HypB [Candidatus Thiodiazotropha taylori]MBT3051566.1 hydrogenase nickel incorporation protein HypB [Candidatus Thiodiazotropha sp. (ex Codakia orbicularis)]MBV2104318.1 hydrogenase nickel incorporation protein HypB [Candidatus Thiodiazotropha sp. (ex Lucina aurantia)]MCW4235327.1 hydrogenase nickel incorporation protein HypB [Candidatus
MCDTCGCNITEGNRHLIEEGGRHAHTEDGSVAVEVLQNLLSENDHQAAHNREHFDRHQLLAINLMSSPGSGKTRLLETTIDKLGQKYRISVVEGDLETENDAERIREKGVEAIQITTGTACHLDAHMIHHALHQMNLDEVDILFIENVGNLVCPASFDLGQHINITLLSVTEGDDKPSKYPVIFRAADHVLITKSDLLSVLDDFNPERAEQAVRRLAVEAPITLTSAKSGEGMDRWLDWLQEQLELQNDRRSRGETLHPKLQPDGVKLHTDKL